jgi:hypothetical protein
MAATTPSEARMRLLPLVAALALPAAVRAQDELVPVSGYLSSEPADPFPADIGSTVPLHGMNAMLLRPGEWRVLLTGGYEKYVGMADGHDGSSVGEVLGDGFTFAPRRMSVYTARLQGLVGLDEDNTLLAALPWSKSRMRVQTAGSSFTTEAEGLGDLELGLTNRTWQGDSSRLLLYGGLSLPTGSFNETDDIPGTPDQPVDYVMQPGSGTVDLRPALTWLHEKQEWVYGAQLAIVQRLGQNSQGWSASNEQELSVWAAQRLDEESSITGRVTALFWGDVHGADDDLDPTLSPTQDPHRQGGKRVDVALGYRDHGFVFEAGVPIFRRLDGPQLDLDWYASVGWQFAF